MLVTIQVFHFIGLALLIGGSVCNAVLLAKAGTGEDHARAALRSGTRRIGQISFIGLLLMWISGVYWIAEAGYSWGDMPWLFWGKMVAVVLLSVSAVATQIYSVMAIFSGSRTPREKVIRLTSVTTLLALLALVLAVLAFGGHAEPTADMPAEVPEVMPSDAPVGAPEAPAAT